MEATTKMRDRIVGLLAMGGMNLVMRWLMRTHNRDDAWEPGLRTAAPAMPRSPS